MVDEKNSPAALRTVAVFEAVKGVLVLALGLGLLSLLHKDVEDLAENLLFRLHINSDHKVGHAIVNAASKLTDGRLWGIAALAIADSGVRFVEAWGLWKRHVWAQWLAVVTGAVYLPWEIIKLAERANWLHISVFVVNLAILLYMLYIRIQSFRSPVPDAS